MLRKDFLKLSLVERGLGGIKLKIGKPGRKQNYLCDLWQVT